MPAKERLLKILLEKSFKHSLVSGRMSNYYINCKATTLDPEAMLLIGHLFYNKVKSLHINAIGGLTLGADPIAFATAISSYKAALVSGMQDDAINAFVVRKKAKEHGLMKWIEGSVQEGNKVVIVDDVVTTGLSTIEAIDRARESNLNVIKVVALVDRQEGGRENIEKRNVPFESIFTKDELINLHKQHIGSREENCKKKSVGKPGKNRFINTPICIEPEPTIYTTGANLRPISFVCDGKARWMWVVAEFMDDSFRDGDVYNPPECAATKDELLINTTPDSKDYCDGCKKLGETTCAGIRSGCWEGGQND